MSDSQLIQGAGQAARAEGVGKLAKSMAGSAVAGHLSQGLAQVFQKRNREWNAMMETQLNKEGLTDAEYQNLYQKFKERRGAYVYLNKKDRGEMERELMKDANNYKKKENDLDEIVDADIDANDLGPGLTDDINDMVDGTKSPETDEYGRVGYSLRSDALKEFVVEGEDGENKLLGYSAAWDDDRFTVSKDGKFKTDKFGNKYSNDKEGKAKFTRDAKLYWIRQAKKTGNKLLHYNSTTGKREYLTPDEAEALLNSPDQFVTLDEIKDHINNKKPNTEVNNSIKNSIKKSGDDASKLKKTDNKNFNYNKKKAEFDKMITPENMHKLARDKTVVGNTSWEQDFVEKLTKSNYDDLGIDPAQLEGMDPTPGDGITKADAVAIKNAVMEDDDLLKDSLTNYFTLYSQREHTNNMPSQPNELLETLNKTMNETEVLPHVQKYLPEGYTVAEAFPGDDGIKIVAPNGKKLKILMKNFLGYSMGAPAIIKKIDEFVATNTASGEDLTAGGGGDTIGEDGVFVPGDDYENKNPENKNPENKNPENKKEVKKQPVNNKEYNYSAISPLSVKAGGGKANILENGKMITMQNVPTGNFMIPTVSVTGVTAKGSSIVINTSMGMDQDFGTFKKQGNKYVWHGDSKNMKLFNENASASQKKSFNEFIRIVETDSAYAEQLLNHIKSGSGTISAATLK
jgi:hypothetical protein